MRTFHRLGLLVAPLVMPVGLLLAHTTLVRSDPARDARLPQPPRIIQLVFSESVTPATSRVELVTPDAQRIRLDVRADSANNPKALVAVVPAVALAGRYRVDWRLIGPDGHAVTGRYSFTVDSALPAATPPASQSRDTSVTRAPAGATFAPNAPLQVLVRFLWMAGLMVIFGATVFGLIVLPRSGVDSDAEFERALDSRLRATARAGSWLLLVLAFLRLTSQGAALGGGLAEVRLTDLAGIVSSTSWGRAWLVVVAVLVLLLVTSRRIARDYWPRVATICVIMGLSAPFLGHPAAADNAVLAIGLDAVHVLAAGGWAGAVLVLAAVAVPLAMSRPMDQRLRVMRALLRSFSPLALTCAAILLLTGIGGAWLQLGTLTAEWSSPYGTALVRKLVLVVVVAVLGAWHWRVAQPSLEHHTSLGMLRWSTALDVLAVLGVLVLTAVLTGTPPPTDVP